MAACSKKNEMASVVGANAPVAKATANTVNTAQGSGVEQAKMAQRHVELRHSLVIEVAADRLEAVWNQQLQACQFPACEVVTAEMNRQERDYSSAHLVLRIDPAQAAGLLDTLLGLGKVAVHEMSQTDRTNEVIDIQAQLDNQKALRDRLRALTASHAGKLSELLELERELARVQGEIDALTGKIRATLQLTEKTTLDVTFRTPAGFSHGGVWAPVSNAWGEMGSVLAGSLAALLVVVSGGLPWLFALCILIFVIRLLRRKARAGAQVLPPIAASNDAVPPK
ncbi:DUF4349 domain-containing protein [Uliginosibacterium gangwonense]|uniref:DUF4349 domain-containing protein n=1 Tax=Uliginosibacterium gangwonense TaxID=392736 RepID=UPI0012F89A31|nr:DUF4349 domain-containing protein [Uliginosibacterium gangwonense]